MISLNAIIKSEDHHLQRRTIRKPDTNKPSCIYIVYPIGNHGTFTTLPIITNNLRLHPIQRNAPDSARFGEVLRHLHGRAAHKPEQPDQNLRGDALRGVQLPRPGARLQRNPAAGVQRDRRRRRRDAPEGLLQASEAGRRRGRRLPALQAPEFVRGDQDARQFGHRSVL